MRDHRSRQIWYNFLISINFLQINDNFLICKANVLLIENLETHLFCIAKKILIANLAPKEQDASLQEVLPSKIKLD